MRLEVLPDGDSAAHRAAQFIAAEACAAIAARGRFIFAVSGGKTPWRMLQYLADIDIDWNGTHLFQVDERFAPAGDDTRNLTHIQACLRGKPCQVHAMPVEASDPDVAAARYARELASVAGAPAVLDLVHLGLGADGHTASLVPGDPVLGIVDADVALAGPYQGTRRMTLTYPALNRARRILWLVSGAEKSVVAARLLAGDRTIPAGRVNQTNAIAIIDGPAARTWVRCGMQDYN